MSRFRGAAGMSVTRMFVCALVRCFDMEVPLTAATEQAQVVWLPENGSLCCTVFISKGFDFRFWKRILSLGARCFTDFGLSVTSLAG